MGPGQLTVDAGRPDGAIADGGSTTVDGRAPDAAPPAPAVSFDGKPIDLGGADCGGVPATRTVELTNTGGKALELGFIASAPFVVAPATLTVAPGAKGTVTLSVSVPSTATAGAKITGTVSLTTNDPSKPKLTAPVSITPQGATIAFDTGSPTTADFGSAKIGVKDTDVTLTLRNTGNKPATVALGAPGDAQFTVASTPASPAAIDPGATATVTASFTPDKLTPSASSSSLTITGPVCGGGITKIDLGGQGTVGAVAGWPVAGLDFGASPCGGAAASTRTFQLANTGTAEVTLSSVTLGSKGYTASVAAGAKIAAGGTLDVTVTPPAIPAQSAVPGDYGDTLTITTDVRNDTPHSIPLTVAASGAILEIDTSATPGFGGFGVVPVGTTSSHAFTLHNTGNAPANVTATAGTGRFGVSVGDFTVDANGSQSLSASFSPNAIDPQTGSLSFTATGLCQPLPGGLPLSGTGQNGGVSLSETSIAFAPRCGTTADPKSFTITNSGNAPMTWNAALGSATSQYTIAPATATLAAGEVSTITVTPAAIPQHPADVSPTAYADTITITTDVQGDTPHVVSLSETPIGAVLTFDASSLDFGDVSIDTTSAAQTLHVVNSGNPGSDVAVTLASSDASFGLVSAAGSSSPGAAFASGVAFTPAAPAGTKSGTVSLAVEPGAALCAPLPAAVNLVGVGTVAQVSWGPQNLDFGLVNCGATGAPQTVTFSNPGNQDYRITGTELETGTHYEVTMTPPSGIVPKNNGGTVVVTVTPRAIPSTVPSVPALDTYKDVLTIKTNAANDVDHVVDLAMGARGVILRQLASKTWDFGSVNHGATSFFNQGLRNDGNVGVTVSMTGTTLPVFGFNATTIPAHSSRTISGSFTPDSPTQSYVDAATLVVPANTVFCQPPPGYDVTMSGKGASGSTIAVTGGLAFPSVDCNATPRAAQSVVVHNNGNTPLPYSAGFDFGTWYTIVSGGEGTIPANGGTATISVQPKRIEPGPDTYSGSAPYSDRLIVNLNGASQAVPISMTATGTDFNNWGWDDWSSDYYDWYYYGYSAFRQHGYYVHDTGSICFQNGGNRSVTMTTTFDSPNWSTNGPLFSPPGSGWMCQELRYNGTSPPLACGEKRHTATLAFSGAVCRTGLPTTIQVRGYNYNCNYQP